MFVLSYFRQDMDLSDFKVIAVSKDREILERKKKELEIPSIEYATAYKEYVENAKESIKTFCERQRNAIPFNKHAHKNYVINEIEKHVSYLLDNYYYFDGNKINEHYIGKHINLEMLTEPLPVLHPPEKPTVECYPENSWGGQGLNIDEVIEL